MEPISIYPHVGGAINSLDDNVAYSLQPQNAIEILPVSRNKYYTIPATQEKVITIAATGSVTAEQSGCTVLLSHAAATVISLPAPEAGLNYKFVISAAVANAVTIRATGAIQSACLASCTATIAECIAVACAGVTDVIFTASAAVGSYYEVYSNGTAWIGRGVSRVASGFSTA